jgi:outer membrane receptor protein involved in Fe transport
VASYQTENRSSLLGAPNHKVTASTVWRFSKDWLWNVNASYASERYAYQYETGGLGKLPPEWLVNSYVEYRYKRVSMGLGVANLLNQQRWFPQPYAGSSGPLPGRSREFYARLRAEF